MSQPQSDSQSKLESLFAKCPTEGMLLAAAELLASSVSAPDPTVYEDICPSQVQVPTQSAWIPAHPAFQDVHPL